VFGDGSKESFSPDGASTPGFAPVFTPDGKHLVYTKFDLTDASSEVQLWQLELTGDANPLPLYVAPGGHGFPVVSPDGRYVAFMNDEGETNVYVCRFPEGDNAQQVSLAGGHWPRWSADGDKIYYIKGADLMAVSFDGGPAVGIGTPERVVTLPETQRQEATGLSVRYDISPVDSSILVARPIEGDVSPLPQTGFIVVQNWFAKFSPE